MRSFLNSTLCMALFWTSTQALAADKYWDTDVVAPLRGNTSTMNIGDLLWSTSPAGDTPLTIIAPGDDIFFQTDTNQTYTTHLDAAQIIGALTVSNGNHVTITINDDANTLSCSNTITIAEGSSLTLLQMSNALLLDGAPRTDVILGPGDNTLTLSGGSGSAQFWLGGINGDAGDTVVFDGATSWIRMDGVSHFGGQLIGSQRLSPGTLTLTGDNPDFSGSLEGGTVILGDGGTNGTMGTARRTALGGLTFNRADDYVFTNDVSVGNDVTIKNDGTGTVTILADLNPQNFFPGGSNVILRGHIDVAARLWFGGDAGTWIFAGTTNSAGGSIYNPGLRTSSGSSMRIGDGTSNVTMTANRNCQIADNSDLILDLNGGALLTVNSNLVVGTACNLVIIGDGQETPIISCSNTLTPFDNVIYNGVSYTWAEAQVPYGLSGVYGRTQMRVVGNDIYIDPLPARGTVLTLQ